jgi:hypothetical protein
MELKLAFEMKTGHAQSCSKKSTDWSLPTRAIGKNCGAGFDLFGY